MVGCGHNMYSIKNKFKGAGGAMYVIIIVFLMTVVAGSLVGWQLPGLDDSKVGSPVTIITTTPEPSKGNLQLYTFRGATLTPAPVNSGCKIAQFHLEDEILVGSDPPPGGQTSGNLRVWVTDELAPQISPGEVVDQVTGQITTIGDRTAKDFDTDGEGKYLWEPSLYVKPAIGAIPSQPFCDAVTPGCIPYFPVIIKGEYNSYGFYDRSGDLFELGPPIDADWINFKNGPGGASAPSGYRYGQGTPFMSEYIWDVTTFGLAKGTYWAQFVIHDGDPNLGISCVTIQI